MAVVIALALREAIVAARLDSGIPTTEWYQEGNILWPIDANISLFAMIPRIIIKFVSKVLFFMDIDWKVRQNKHKNYEALIKS